MPIPGAALHDEESTGAEAEPLERIGDDGQLRLASRHAGGLQLMDGRPGDDLCLVDVACRDGAISPRLLGVVERGVGLFHQRTAVSSVVGSGGDSDAHGDRDALTAPHAKLVIHRPLQDPIGEQAGQLAIGPRQQHHELVTAEADGKSLLAGHVREQTRQPAERLVARIVPQRVVDLLEMVEIHDQERERVVLAGVCPSRRGTASPMLETSECHSNLIG